MAKILLPKFERITSIGRQLPKSTELNSIYNRLPEHYKKRHREFFNTERTPVHYKPAESKYEVDHDHGVR